MMVVFRAGRETLTRPWAARHDWARRGSVRARQIVMIYELDPAACEVVGKITRVRAVRGVPVRLSGEEDLPAA